MQNLNNYSTKKRLIFVIAVFLILLLLLFIYIYLFENFKIAIPCVFHEITNLFCPGCGATRVIIALINFDFAVAIKQNIVLTFLFPLLAIYFLDKIVAWILRKKPKFADDIPNFVWYIFAIVLLLFGILRNLPYFDFLRPF